MIEGCLYATFNSVTPSDGQWMRQSVAGRSSDAKQGYIPVTLLVALAGTIWQDFVIRPSGFFDLPVLSFNLAVGPVPMQAIPLFEGAFFGIPPSPPYGK